MTGPGVEPGLKIGHGVAYKTEACGRQALRHGRARPVMFYNRIQKFGCVVFRKQRWGLNKYSGVHMTCSNHLIVMERIKIQIVRAK